MSAQLLDLLKQVGAVLWTLIQKLIHGDVLRDLVSALLVSDDTEAPGLLRALNVTVTL